jgi:ABC-type Fe3+/spermidine/putrescine transport system ATPase subunit
MIELDSFTVSVEGRLIIDNLTISLRIDPWGGLAVMGVSGSGKTTLIKALAGLSDVVASGRITVGGRRLDGLGISKRGIGVCFQEFLLLPNMTAMENAMLACNDKAFVDELMEIFMVRQLASQLPASLSGGEQQRIALIRAIAARPKLLLLDEPFSNIDESLKDGMLRSMQALLFRENLPFIMVTHNKKEAFYLCNDLLVLDCGRIIYAGSIADCYCSPPSMKAATLLGDCNELLVYGRKLLVRPEAIRLFYGRCPAMNCLDEVFLVKQSLYVGREYHVVVEGGASGTRLLVYTDKPPKEGDKLFVSLGNREEERI